MTEFLVFYFEKIRLFLLENSKDVKIICLKSVLRRKDFIGDKMYVLWDQVINENTLSHWACRSVFKPSNIESDSKSKFWQVLTSERLSNKMKEFLVFYLKKIRLILLENRKDAKIICQESVFKAQGFYLW